jgi:hypothetical protein
VARKIAFFSVHDVIERGPFEGSPSVAYQLVRFLDSAVTSAAQSSEPELVFSFDPKVDKPDRADDVNAPRSRYTTPTVGAVVASMSTGRTGAQRVRVYSVVLDTNPAAIDLEWWLNGILFSRPNHDASDTFEHPLGAAILGTVYA